MKVSVISPVYGVEDYIDDFLDSMSAQSMQELEIICVSDACTDGSVEKIKARMLRDPRFVLIEAEKNVGAGAARNLALNVARGEYVGFVDADDRVSEDYCQKLYDAAIAQNADIVKCRLDRFWHGEDKKESGLGRLKNIQSDLDKKRFPVLFCGSQHISCLYRRTLFDAPDMRFPERDQCRFTNGEDDVLLLRILLSGPKISLLFDDDAVYFYRKRRNSQTSVLNEQRYRGVILPRRIAMDCLNASSLPENDYRRLVDRFLREMASHYRMYKNYRNFDRLRYIKGMAEVYDKVKNKDLFEEEYFRSYLKFLRNDDFGEAEKRLNNIFFHAFDQSFLGGCKLYRLVAR